MCSAPHKCPRPRDLNRIHPLLTFYYGLGTGSRTKPRNAVRSILDACFQDVISSPGEWILRRVGNVSGHHTPDKTGQFARNCGFGNIVPGLKCDAVIFALHAFIGFIRVSDDLGRIAALSDLERCALFPNGSSIVGLSCLDQQSP